MTFRVEDDNAVYTREYDGADRLIRTTIPLLDTNSMPGTVFTNVTIFTYDGNDNRVSITERHVNPEGAPTPFDAGDHSGLRRPGPDDPGDGSPGPYPLY